MRIEGQLRFFVLVFCLFVAGGRRLAAAAEPACPAGEITLSSASLTVAGKGSATDSIDDRLSTFVLPQGVSIDPGNEAMSFVVEGDHQPIFQADVPSGGLVARRQGRLFELSAQAADAIGAGSRLTLRRRGLAFRMSVRLKHLGAAGLATVPHFAKILVKFGDDCFSSVLACS